MTANPENAAVCGLPNKPVLPTAHTWLNADPLGPMRRQTGQPLGSRASLAGGAGNPISPRI